MARLVDADSLIKAIKNIATEISFDEPITKVVVKGEEYAKVVRCKDCEYFKKIAERSDSGLCHRDIVASAWKENGYCSRAKMKGGE